MFILIIALFVVLILIFWYIKKYRCINDNKTFINKRIKYITKYFEKDTHLDLIVNYKNKEIVGFFFVVNDVSSYRWLNDAIQGKQLPNTSHELSINEFCNFIYEYTQPDCYTDDIIKVILTMHLERLS